MLHVLVLLFPSLASPTGLQACVHQWQRHMQLQEWRITVRVVPRAALDDSTVGNIEPDRATRTAILRVMRVEDSDLTGHLALADQRLTIAHEMVHLYRYAVVRDPRWFDEPSTNFQTALLVRKHKMRQELLVLEP
jgi:hypothetical protein